VVLFEEVLETDGADLTAWMNLGLLFQEKLNDRDRAVHAYEQYLKHGGDDERVRRWLAELKDR